MQALFLISKPEVKKLRSFFDRCRLTLLLNYSKSKQTIVRFSECKGASFIFNIQQLEQKNNGEFYRRIFNSFSNPLNQISFEICECEGTNLWGNCKDWLDK
ncbi:hypothetical protein [Microscilla marina]|uniref:Uncharacterized protein n=1 Tax=Microscilla marina ATCC 23134 TaxID=313606 RepID=A2A036_MICM2|nr:hypothetical protein [Microscilla marina]EAY23994.1 hypothetical protein M23134_03027 [Microscilla marina ATCC 23134]